MIFDAFSYVKSMEGHYIFVHNDKFILTFEYVFNNICNIKSGHKEIVKYLKELGIFEEIVKSEPDIFVDNFDENNELKIYMMEA